MEAITNLAFKGSFNATAPNPVRMGELCSALGRSLGRPSWLPVPAFALSVRPPLMLAAACSCVIERWGDGSPALS